MPDPGGRSFTKLHWQTWVLPLLGCLVVLVGTATEVLVADTVKTCPQVPSSLLIDQRRAKRAACQSH